MLFVCYLLQTEIAIAVAIVGSVPLLKLFVLVEIAFGKSAVAIAFARMALCRSRSFAFVPRIQQYMRKPKPVVIDILSARMTY